MTHYPRERPARRPHVGPHLTRRGLIVGAGIAGLVAAVGGRGRTAAREVAATPADPPRSVEHGLDVAEVPVAPRRLVALGSAVEGALPAGITPVGVDERSAQKAYLSHRVVGVPAVGRGGQPDLERIAALDPDLMLGLDLVVEEAGVAGTAGRRVWAVPTARSRTVAAMRLDTHARHP